MEEITIKVTKAQADRILEALKYKATLNKGSILHEDFCETYYNVKSQIENQ